VPRDLAATTAGWEGHWRGTAPGGRHDTPQVSFVVPVHGTQDRLRSLLAT
jgi:hypothetical protein